MPDVFLNIKGNVTLHKLGEKEGKTKCNTSITTERQINNANGDFRICKSCCKDITASKIENTVAYLSQKRRTVQTIIKFRKEPDILKILSNVNKK